MGHSKYSTFEGRRKEMTMTKFEKQIKKLLSEQQQLLAQKSKEGVTIWC